MSTDLNELLKTATRTAAEYNAAGFIKRQKFTVSRYCTLDGERVQVRASVRFDDECGNKHESFSITGEVREVRKDFTTGQEYAPSGCVHEHIAAAFPELAPFIKWHLVSTPGPMHYAANTIYLAGDRDYNGKRAGEVSSYDDGLRFGNSPITYKASRRLVTWLLDMREKFPGLDWRFEPIEHKKEPGGYEYAAHYTPTRGGEAFASVWHECPFRTLNEAEEVTQALNTLLWEAVRVPSSYSKGKPRELDAARRAAIWPDASDDDLTAPGLAERLAARLPALMAEFKADMLALGFTWPEVKTEEAAALSAS